MHSRNQKAEFVGAAFLKRNRTLVLTLVVTSAPPLFLNNRYNLRTLQYPFQAKIVDTLMQFLSIILGVRYTWPNLMLFFSNNDANVKAGVREALIRPYEVRLVDLVCEGRGFDIMALAGSSALGAALPYMAHPDIHPDNSVFRCVRG
jgi:hypothetical protein